MRILFLGSSARYSGSWQRLQALHRLGHEVVAHDIESTVIRNRLSSFFHYRTGYRWVQSVVGAQLRCWLAQEKFDLAWVEGGAVLGRCPLALVREHCRVVVNYNNDDPTGPRDWPRWRTLRQAVSCYDQHITVRTTTRRELESLGAARVIRVFMSYDDELMRRVVIAPEEEVRLAAEVLFVGTWMPERGAFLAALVRQGIPLSIYGNRWERAREWRDLRANFRGPGIVGPEYTKLLQSAKINLGLLSKGNRDLHTIRSSEIPYVGSLLCAERTVEHEQMYSDGTEAVFWSSPEECAALCRNLLADGARCRAIAERGHYRVQKLRLAHVDVLSDVLLQV